MTPDHAPNAVIVDIDVYAPPGFERDPQRAWVEFRDAQSADIVWTTGNGGHWIALRGELIRAIYEDYGNFSTRAIFVPRDSSTAKLLPNTIDPPHHQPYRAQFNSGLSPRAVAKIEPAVRAYARGLIDRLAPAGRCDFVADFAALLPIGSFLSISGLPDSDGPVLQRLAHSLNRPEKGAETLREVEAGFADYILPLIEARRREPRDDLIGSIVAGQVHGRPLDDDEIVQMVTLALIGSLGTIISLISSAMLHLARCPDARRQLVRDPGLIVAAVDEYARRFPMATNVRYVTRDLDFAGVAMREGDLVALPTALHGLDERVHSCPLDVAFEREPGPVSTFGAGPHRCPGAYLAKAEIRIAIEEWLARIPEFEVEPGTALIHLGGVVSGLTALPLRWDR